MWAILYNKPAIARWVIEHRSQHNLETVDGDGRTALHRASYRGQLAVMQALVAAGANPAAHDGEGRTPLIEASNKGRTRIVAFFLQLPAVKASINHISFWADTALSCASREGHQSIVQLLLVAGADPTIPAGERSPLNLAIRNNQQAIAALLRHVIAEADRTHALHKARSVLGAGAAAPACLQGRMERGEALPQLGFVRRGRSNNEELFAATAFAVGVSGGEKDTGLCDDLNRKLPGYMLPAWAEQGPNA